MRRPLHAAADEIAEAFHAPAKKNSHDIEIVRNGSRGLHWLEPLIEVVTPKGPGRLRPATLADVDGILKAAMAGAGNHKLNVGVVDGNSLAEETDAASPSSAAASSIALAGRLQGAWRLQGLGEGAPGRQRSHHRGSHAVGSSRSRRRGIPDRHQVGRPSRRPSPRRNISSATLTEGR